MATERPRKTKTMHIRNGKLWPSTLYLGKAVVKFITGKRGRSITIQYHGKGKPRHRGFDKTKPKVI